MADEEEHPAHQPSPTNPYHQDRYSADDRSPSEQEASLVGREHQSTAAIGALVGHFTEISSALGRLVETREYQTT